MGHEGAMILHLITVTLALANNPTVIVLACLDNPLFVLLLLSLSWLLPEISERR
jgi:hypothetical protein